MAALLMSHRRILLASLLLLHAFIAFTAASRLGQSKKSQNPLVGHILPHSHCDAAYKKSLAEYYETEVRNVLNSVLQALEEDPSRRFVWAETIFLTMWWNDPRTTGSQRLALQQLVGANNGAIELVGGGWVMHDESITRYDSQIHQTTYGHDVLNQLLLKLHNNKTNDQLQTAYQIDPFGPSSFTITLHASAGMKMLLHNRLPDDIKDELRLNQSLQFYWETPGGDDRLWVHVYDHHYESPAGFDWEGFEVPSVPTTKNNVQLQTDAYMAVLREKGTYYRTNHVLIPFGGDFRFQNASWQFQNMDQIVQYANANHDRYQGDSLRYTTVRDYRHAVFSTASEDTFPVFSGSPFLPMWSGYYTQIPMLKQMVRTCEILLRVVELQVLQWAIHGGGVGDGGEASRVWNWLRTARETVYMMQHHDALPATSYRFVLLDYMKQLKRAFVSMTDILTATTSATTTTRFPEEQGEGQNAEVDLSAKIIGGGPYIHETVLVRGVEDSRNIEVDRILDPQMGMPGINMVVVNSLGWSVDTMVSFVCSRSDVAIVHHDDENSSSAIVSQATPLEKEVVSANLGLYLITFRATIRPLDRAYYSIHVCDLTWDTFQDPPVVDPSLICATTADTMTTDDVMRHGISAGAVAVTFDPKTYDLSAVTWTTHEGDQLALGLSHDIILYDGTNDTIYDVKTDLKLSDPRPLLGDQQRLIVSAYQGPLFSQVTIELTPWLTVRYRVTNGSDLNSMLQMSMLSGPIPPSVNLASRLSTNLTKSRWFYEENGFQAVEATYNEEAGVGRSIRPMVSSSWLQEDSTQSNTEAPNRFTVVTIDPRGVVSRYPGSLDIFWHRRNNGTVDWLKQGEDVSTVRSSVWLNFDRAPATSSHRTLSTPLANDVILYWTGTPRKMENIAMNELPKQLHLVSYRISGNKSTHPFEKDEGASDSQEFWIDIQIENLSDESIDIPLKNLVPQTSNVLLNYASLRTLTFLHQQDDLDTLTSLKACNQEGLDGTDQQLRVHPRRICSVRVPVHLMDDEPSSRA